MLTLDSLHPQNNPNHLCLETGPEEAHAYTACHPGFNEEEKELMEKALTEMRAKEKAQYELKFIPLFQRYL